ncbi:tRNA pseudouridine synthase A [Bacilli bacterium]|nr:tRNA pseudouridine synthase A [Bacilli bacterium]
MRYKLCVEYDGTNYSGWQKQGHGLSLQEVMEDCIFKLSGEKVNVVGSGRTDAGVHALGQVIHFDLNKQLTESTIVEGLNYYLCEWNRIKIKRLQKLIITEFGSFYRSYGVLSEQDIVIKSCEVVDDNFHARFSSKMRHYKYIIINSKAPLALWRNRAWHVPLPILDVDRMHEASQLLIGLHDFSSFRDSQCQAPSPFKTISNCSVRRKNDIITFEISAKSFLHHMIRNIIGTLKGVGKYEITPHEFRNILESKNRQRAGVNAPACGLYFVGVDY